MVVINKIRLNKKAEKYVELYLNIGQFRNVISDRTLPKIQNPGQVTDELSPEPNSKNTEITHNHIWTGDAGVHWILWGKMLIQGGGGKNING